MIRASRFILVFAAVLCLASPFLSGQEVLRWKLKKGQRFEVVLTQHAIDKQVIKGTTREVPIDLTIKMHWRVDRVTDDLMQITQEFASLKLEMTNPAGKRVEIDTDNPPQGSGVEANLAKGWRPLIGMTAVQTIDSRGRTKIVEVDEKVLEEMKENQLLAQFASPEVLKRMISQNAPVLPEKPVKIGSTWSRTTKNKSSMGMATSKTDYGLAETVKRGGRELKRISVVTHVDFALDNPDAGSITVDRQENVGTIYFDNVAGYIDSSEMKQDMVLTIDDRRNRAKQTILVETKLTITPVK